jgi:hypothetical protein
MEGDEQLRRIDLQLGPAEVVSPHEVYVKVEGVEPERVEAVRRRVADVFAREPDVDSLATTLGPPPPARRQRRAGALDVRVVGQSLSPARQQELEEAIGREVDDELGDEPLPGIGGVGPAGSHCGCAHIGLGGDRIPIGGDAPWFAADGTWRPPPGGGDFWNVGIMLDAPTFNQATMTVRPGSAADPPFGKDQTLIGLTNATDWAKQVWATNLCEGRTKSIFQRGRNDLAHQMQLIRLSCRQGTDTLEFSKPGFLGGAVWHDVGHIPPEAFWRWFGGAWAIIRWTID